MAVTTEMTDEQLEDIFKNENYLDWCKTIEARTFNLGVPEDDRIIVLVDLCQVLRGNFELLMRERLTFLATQYSSKSPVGQLARYGLAIVFYSQGNVQMGNKAINALPYTLFCDSIRSRAFLFMVRKGLCLSVAETIKVLLRALEGVPYSVINANIFKDCVEAVYLAREQKDTQPYLFALPGLILTASGICQKENASKNRLAETILLSSRVYYTFGWKKFALVEARTANKLWEEVFAKEQECYSNLEEAKDWLARLRKEGIRL